jgi:hypothetical protein
METQTPQKGEEKNNQDGHAIQSGGDTFSCSKEECIADEQGGATPHVSTYNQK